MATAQCIQAWRCGEERLTEVQNKHQNEEQSELGNSQRGECGSLCQKDCQRVSQTAADPFRFNETVTQITTRSDEFADFFIPVNKAFSLPRWIFRGSNVFIEVYAMKKSPM